MFPSAVVAEVAQVVAAVAAVKAAPNQLAAEDLHRHAAVVALAVDRVQRAQVLADALSRAVVSSLAKHVHLRTPSLNTYWATFDSGLSRG